MSDHGNPKLVSVGIPVYNEIERLADCIGFVRKQTYPNIEICVSDNCSTDGTYDLAQKLLQDWPRSRLIRQEKNFGFAANWDAVRRLATGEYYMWLAADDEIRPTHIEKMVEQLESHPRAVGSQSATLRIRAGGDVRHQVRFTGAYNPNSIGVLRQAMNVLSPYAEVRGLKMSQYSSGLYRKSFIDGIMNQRENVFAGGDRMFVALAALSGGLRYVDEFLFVKNLHARSYDQRHPTDAFNSVKARRRKKIAWETVRWVFKCPTVPLWRRWYGLIIAFPFVLMALEKSRHVPSPVRNGMRRLSLGFDRPAAEK